MVGGTGFSVLTGCYVITAVLDTQEINQFLPPVSRLRSGATANLGGASALDLGRRCSDRDHFHSDELEVHGLGWDCTTHLVATHLAELGLVVAVTESQGLGESPRGKASAVLFQGQRRR